MRPGRRKPTDPTERHIQVSLHYSDEEWAPIARYAAKRGFNLERGDRSRTIRELVEIGLSALGSSCERIREAVEKA